jgi:hypothetical protein
MLKKYLLVAFTLTCAIAHAQQPPPAPSNPPANADAGAAAGIALGAMNLAGSVLGVVGGTVSLGKRRWHSGWAGAGYVIGTGSLVVGALLVAVGETQGLPHSDVLVGLGAGNLVFGAGNIAVAVGNTILGTGRYYAVPWFGRDAVGATVTGGGLRIDL